MDERKIQLKRLKKNSKRAKRRRVMIWKTFGILFLVLAVLFSVATPIAFLMDNAVAILTGGSFWKVVDPDPNALYFTQDYATPEERTRAGEELRYEVESEAAVLLMNQGVLPLESGAAVSTLASPDQLRSQLTHAGLRVCSSDEAADAVIVTLIDADLNSSQRSSLAAAAKMKKNGTAKAIVVLLATGEPAKLDFLQSSKYTVDACLWIGDSETQAVADLLAGKRNPCGALAAAFAEESGKQNLGYQSHETRYESYVMGDGAAGSYSYKDSVSYPFGYGLSYTSFAFSDLKVEEEATCFRIQVGVTNTGNAAGKKTVQIYAQSAQTNDDGEQKAEQAAASLVGFGKTGLIQPGSTEAVTVVVEKQELATWDTRGNCILNAGDYYLSVAADAHDAVNNILAAKGCNAANTDGRMDGEGNLALTFKWTHQTPDAQTDGQTGAENEKPEMPITGAKNGLKLIQMRGLAYDDLKWQRLLDQLSFKDMVTMISDGFGWRMPAGSVHAPGIRDRQPSEYSYGQERVQTTRFLSATAMASTFNTELLHRVGNYLGNDCLASETYIFYGLPVDLGMDAFLCSAVCAAQVGGIREKGIQVALTADHTYAENWQEVFRRVMEQERTTGILVTDELAPITDRMYRQWGSQGVAVTEISVEPAYTAAEGILAGIGVQGALLPCMQEELAAYENDPAVVSAMRQICHRSLYVLVNSAAMNGIGPDSGIRVTVPQAVLLIPAVALGLWILFIPMLILWVRGKKKWKKTPAYLNYRTLKKTLKAEKRMK